MSIRIRSVQYLLMRLAEPSSYAGLGMVLTLLGFSVPDSLLQSGIHLAVGACGVAAFLLQEKGSP